FGLLRELAQRLRARAALDRKEPERWRPRRIARDLERAAAREGGRCRQQRGADMREEERVDERGARRRRLADEGDREPLGREPPLEMGEACGLLLLDEARDHGPAAEIGEAAGGIVAPLPELPQALLERLRG